MLRITASTNAQAAKQYYTQGLTRSDYYIAGQELPGVWGGKGATMLGLSGEINQKDYFALCDNLNPKTGERLTPRQKDNRRVGYDFTFSAPKSVSVLYELSGDERVLDAFRQSVRETMTEIETEMKTRVRANGGNADRVTGNMAYAEFVHFTSRPVDGKPDPHLHAHCFAFNFSWDKTERRWKAGQFGDLKRDATYYEAAFDARLADRLKHLGYAAEKDPKYSFEMAGMPESVIDKFSRRRNVIEEKAAEKGVVDAVGKHSIGIQGREKKTLDMAKAELREEWRARLTDVERGAFNDVLAGKGKASVTLTPEEAMQYAVDHSFERYSVISEKRLKAEALKAGVGSVLPDEINTGHTDIINRDVDGQKMVTTRKVLEGEREMLRFAREGKGSCKPFGLQNEGWIRDLNEEQRQAAWTVLNSRDRVTGVIGAAGTGKTRMMKDTIAAIERDDPKANRQVFVFAPSAQASRGVLRNEGFRNAETLERLLVDERLQSQVKGQVLWCDEAGMVSNRDMRRLFDVAKKQDCRVILSGDYKQHGSVKSGDAFRLLESEAGVKYAGLKTIRRQQANDYRQAVKEISEGNPGRGFDRLDKMGAIVEAAGDERHKLLVKDYLKATDEKKSALIIAPTHAEGDRLTAELRTALKERGELGKDRKFKVRRGTNWTDAQKTDARNYQAGLVVEFHQNAKGGFKRGEGGVVLGNKEGSVSLLRQNGTQSELPLKEAARFQVYSVHDQAIAKGERIRIMQKGNINGKRINNGDIYTVEGFNQEGDMKLSNGQVLPKTYGHFGLGYVDTSYASQGKTVDRVFVATGNESLAAADAKQWYVSVSRGREACKVYVDSKDDVRDAIQRSGKRMSAVELVNKKPEELGIARYQRMRAMEAERPRVKERTLRYGG